MFDRVVLAGQTTDGGLEDQQGFGQQGDERDDAEDSIDRGELCDVGFGFVLVEIHQAVHLGEEALGRADDGGGDEPEFLGVDGVVRVGFLEQALDAVHRLGHVRLEVLETGGDGGRVEPPEAHGLVADDEAFVAGSPQFERF